MVDSKTQSAPRRRTNNWPPQTDEVEPIGPLEPDPDPMALPPLSPWDVYRSCSNTFLPVVHSSHFVMVRSSTN